MSLSTRRHVLCGVGSLAIAFVAGCGGPSTSVTQVWNAPLAAPPMRKIVVFAARTDEANRRALEDKLVAELAKRGVAAVQGRGFDGILVATLKNVRERLSYVPGTYSGGFWNDYYYGPGWTSWSPGYVRTDEIVNFETTLWDARAEDKLVWAALTKTVNPSSGRDFVKSLTDAVLPPLEKAGRIPPKPEE